MVEEEKRIIKFYKNTLTGLTGYKKIAHKLNLNPNKVKQILDKVKEYKMHIVPKKPKIHPKIIAQYPLQKIQCDIIYCDKAGIGSYKDYFYILSCIDAYSKYVFCVPLKTKTSEEIIKSFKIIFKENTPKTIETDAGKEFDNKNMREYYKSNDIKHHISAFAPIVERFNQTIEKMLIKAIEITEDRNWVKLLPIIVKNYNNTFHSSINTTPKSAFETEIKDEKISKTKI